MTGEMPRSGNSRHDADYNPQIKVSSHGHPDAGGEKGDARSHEPRDTAVGIRHKKEDNRQDNEVKTQRRSGVGKAGVRDKLLKKADVGKAMMSYNGLSPSATQRNKEGKCQP